MVTHKIKVVLAKIIWKICGINWRIGDSIMNLLGTDRYVRIMNLQKEKIWR